MSTKDNFHRPKVFGSTVVSRRGQMVIPANARKELGIDAGDTLLVCGPPHGGGLLLLKVDAVEQMLDLVSEELTNFGKIVKEVRETNSNKRERKRT